MSITYKTLKIKKLKFYWKKYSETILIASTKKFYKNLKKGIILSYRLLNKIDILVLAHVLFAPSDEILFYLIEADQYFAKVFA